MEERGRPEEDNPNLVPLPTDRYERLSYNPRIGKFNDILNDLGRSGVCTCFFATLMNIPIAFHNLSHIFFTHKFEHECVPNTIDKCDPSCTKIIFPNTRNATNIISEWNLICLNKYKQNMPHYIFLVGSMIGSILFGHWADQHGRRPCIMWTCFMMTISGLLAGISRWYWLYCFMQFFIGFSTGGWIVCCMVFLVEFVSVQYREIVILTADVPYCIGYCILPAVAYFLPNWRHIQLLTSGLGFFSLAYIWVLPESPRWLLLTGRIKQCANVVQTSSRNAEIPRVIIMKIIGEAHAELRAGQFAKTGYLVDIFITRKLRKTTFIFGIVWCTLYLVTFGTLFNQEYLRNNLYASVAVNAAIMFCGNLLSFPVINYLNRRTVHAFAYSFTSLWMFLSVILPKFPQPILNEVVASVAISLIPLAFYNLLIFSTELYPTVLRTSGIGFGFFCAQIGTGVIDIIEDIVKGSSIIPSIVCGTLSLISAVIIFFLPETKGVKLHDKLEENEDWIEKERREYMEAKKLDVGKKVKIQNIK